MLFTFFRFFRGERKKYKKSEQSFIILPIFVAELNYTKTMTSQTASPAEVAATLRNTLANKGISMKEASATLGLKATSFSKLVRTMETSGTYMSKKNAVRIAAAFGMNAEFLAHGYGAPTSSGEEDRGGQLHLHPLQAQERQWVRYTYTRERDVELSLPPELLAKILTKIELNETTGAKIWKEAGEDVVHIAAPFTAAQLGEINDLILNS